MLVGLLFVALLLGWIIALASVDVPNNNNSVWQEDQYNSEES